MALIIQLNKALREALGTRRHRQDLSAHRASDGDLLGAREQLETARLAARGARHMLLG